MAETKTKVLWSDSIEVLAERLILEWEEKPPANPFERVCVIVDDLASARQFKNYFLGRPNPQRRIFANFDFIPAAQFVNDWLAGKRFRHPRSHPCSKEVLAWRIFFILKNAPKTPTLAKKLSPLLDYARDNEELAFNLSKELARLYDDYLASRYELLEDWASGKVDGDWQGELYRELASCGHETYSALYRRVIESVGKCLEGKSLFEMPKRIFVFDVPFLHKPWIKFFEFMAKSGIEVEFLSFNPSPDTPWFSKEAKDETDPEEKLVYRLAKGAAPNLEAQFDLADGSVDQISLGKLKKMKSIDAELHIAHSPRRELEAARNAIIGYLAENPGAKPKDILVLCANWPVYSPIIESVFSDLDGNTRFSYDLDQPVEGSNPTANAFSSLIDLAFSRFEASKILSLANIPAVRRKFGFEDMDSEILRSLVKEANIHWGYDSAAVAKALQSVPLEAPYTWRKGLDRMLLGSLTGDTSGELVDAGALGKILPTPYIESERARAAIALCKLTSALGKFASTLTNGIKNPAGVWAEAISSAINTFFETKELDEEKVLSQIRTAIDETKEDIENAIRYNAKSQDEKVGAKVFADAILASIAPCAKAPAPRANAVRFAPLKPAAIREADFIWICGIDSDAFPRTPQKRSFDLIASSPGAFDFTDADKDAYSLLRAALAAGKKLALSYSGINPSNGESKGPSALVTSLVDTLIPNGKKRYIHPLSSSDERYFTESSEALPPNYSLEDYNACKAKLEADRAAVFAKYPGLDTSVEAEEGKKDDLSPLAAFDLSDELDFAQILEFLSSPNDFVCKHTIGISKDRLDKMQVSDSEALEASLAFKDMIAIEKGLADLASSCEALVEKGYANDTSSAKEAIEKVKNSERAKKVAKIQLETFSMSAIEAFRAQLEAKPQAIAIEREFKGAKVTVKGLINLAQSAAGAFFIDYSHSKLTDGEKSKPSYLRAAAPFYARHIAGHLAGLKFTSFLVFDGNGNSNVLVLEPLDRKTAEGKWQYILSLCLGPLPENMPDLSIEWKNDSLPAEKVRRLEENIPAQVISPRVRQQTRRTRKS